jgi:uncharacterized protein (UPF0332 family)
MALHDDLLQQANDLAQKNHPNGIEADFRRAVSSAYYALFHLLIHEACQNWLHSTSKKHLARMFEHSYMKKVSKRVEDPAKMPYVNVDPAIVLQLRKVAHIFSELQDKRHEADYDVARMWSFTEALTDIQTAQNAFQIWNNIRTETIAQEYLVHLLIKPRD